MTDSIYQYIENNADNKWLENYTFLRTMYKGLDTVEIAQNMLNDLYFVPRVGYTNDLFNPDYNVSMLRLIHGFVFMYPLINLYKTTKDKKYLEKCVSILDGWRNEYKYKYKSKCMSFHDETTTLRIRNLIYLFDIGKNVLEIDRLQIIYDEIQYTVEVLLKEEFYSINTNHGFFQDISLIVFSKYFRYDEKVSTCREIAYKRIKSYFDYIFTSDGVHKEHSPEYHFMIITIIKKILDNKLIEDVEFNSYIEKIYLNSSRYSTYIPKPNLYLPTIADTNTNNYINQTYKTVYEDINFHRLIDRQFSSIDLDLDYISKESKIAILRNKWGEDAVYIVLTAGYHASYHKHCDDLSFIVYYNGDIISEAGPFGYAYKDPMCQYGYSGFAHNTLIVNRNSLPRVDGKYDKVGILDFKSEEKLTYVKGFNSRYDGVVHERELHFDKENLVISIFDTITSIKNNDYTLLYHLAKDIKPVKEGNSINLYRLDKLIGKMDVESESEVTLNYSYGIESDYIKGIHFPKGYEFDYNYVIYMDIKEVKDIEITTKLVLYKE